MQFEKPSNKLNLIYNYLEDYMFLTNILIPYFMEFSLDLITFTSLKKEYVFYLKTYFKPDKEKSFEKACFLGNKELISHFMIDDFNLGMARAAEGGHKDLVDFFINKGANFWNWGMSWAAQGNNKDLVLFFIKLGANNWNGGMSCAARGGHKELVEFFINKGADNWNWGIYYAILGSRKDLEKFFRLKLNEV